MREPSAWEKLVERYANGRTICNCRHAYYATGGTYVMNGLYYHDGNFCEHGCTANQAAVREEIAKTVLRELKP